MRVISIVCVLSILLIGAVLNARAATNLNSSRSNVYKLIYSTDTVNASQAAAILADVETATQQSQGKINLEEVVGQALTKQGLDISILLIFLSLMFWSWVLCPLGAILAIPLTLLVKRLIAEIRIENQNGST